MTLEVYRINPQTGARTEVRRKHTVEPADVPDGGHAKLQVGGQLSPG